MSYDFFAQLEHLRPLDITQGGYDTYTKALLVKGVKEVKVGIGKQSPKAWVRERDDEYRQLIWNAVEVDKPLAGLGLTDIDVQNIDALPDEAGILQFRFKLEKKYISKDDEPFYPHDNPVRKEFIFKVPMVSGSSWKGSLRAAAVTNLLDREHLPEVRDGRRVLERLRLKKLFGDEKDSEGVETSSEDKLRVYLDRKMGEAARTTFHQYHAEWSDGDDMRRKGRIRILPSYFDKIDLDIIHPRDRHTRAGSTPITLEVVPKDATALFTLIYLPFDLLGISSGDALRLEILRDIKLLGEALDTLLRRQGLGAKTSSGFGRAFAIRETVVFHNWIAALPLPAVLPLPPELFGEQK